MTRYWQTDPSDPNWTPGHVDEKCSLSQMETVSHIRNQTPLDTSRYNHGCVHTHKKNPQHTKPQPLLYVQSEINEYQRDQAWISMWISYAWRLSEEKGGIRRGTQQRGGEQSREEWRREFGRERGKFPDTEMLLWSPLAKKLEGKGVLLFKENMHDMVSTPLVTIRL